MTEKPHPAPLRPENPKSDQGLSRSAEALRANLLKRKAQKRARADEAPVIEPAGPETAHKEP